MNAAINVRNMAGGTLRRALAVSARLLRDLARDRAGNTMMMVAAAVLPILAMIGGGIDMGRNYLAESRLQQACDAGVLAARKALGSSVLVDAATEAKMETAGSRFFNVNFSSGAYGSQNRHFAMVLNEDLTVDGTANVDMPTTIMQIFGYDQTAIQVECTAKLNVSNTDVMMALDVTGSMRETLPGDSVTKIDALKAVVKSFYTQLETNKVAGMRTRYGFVPYSTNVNVGALLHDDWVVDEWTYQSREWLGTTSSSGTYGYYTAADRVSGDFNSATVSTYTATFDSWSEGYYCPTQPANTGTSDSVLVSTTTEAVTSPVAGTRTIKLYRRTTDGTQYWTSLSGTTCTVHSITYNNYVDEYSYIEEPMTVSSNSWLYRPILKDVRSWRGTSNGCMEERATYEIDDYDNVDLTRALDLDIDTVPTAGDLDTQWRPQYPEIIFDRAIDWWGNGAWSTAPVTSEDDFIAPYWGFAACPAPAKKLAEMNSAQIDNYIDDLEAAGSTYHDIGMIWAGRLLSPTGLFAAENGDSGGLATGRHLIFLTDGQTSTLDISYGAYGVEPLDQRRWSPSSPLTLNETVERRFAFACEEVKKKNVNVWLVAFGTDLNPVMTECAGPGHSFRAGNAEELNEVFATIAKSIGQLRLAR